MKIAVFASGVGSNFEVIVRSEIGGSVDLLYSDVPSAPVLEKACSLGVRTVSAVAPDGLDLSGIDAIVLAGYMRILSPGFVAHWRGRIVNIHPSLLPAFPGLRAVERALRAGVGWTGVTVHEVIAAPDSGRILRQEAVRVEADDDLVRLRKRLTEVEHRIYAPTVAQWLANRSF